MDNSNKQNGKKENNLEGREQMVNENLNQLNEESTLTGTNNRMNAQPEGKDFNQPMNQGNLDANEVLNQGSKIDSDSQMNKQQNNEVNPHARKDSENNHSSEMNIQSQMEKQNPKQTINRDHNSKDFSRDKKDGGKLH